MESSIYFTNLSNQLFKNTSDLNFLNNNNLTHANFNNLNFFENSRLWLFKKYFFNNNQQLSLIVDTPKNIKYLVKQGVPNKLITSSNFNLSIYLSQLQFIQHNNFTPSLSLKDVNTVLSLKSIDTPTNPSNLNTSNLDMLRGMNSSFIYTLTSNPQQSNNTTNYFNPLINLPSTSVNGIKFYQ
jgi:hypothetical protein